MPLPICVVRCRADTRRTVFLWRLYALVAIEHGTRFVHLAGITANPDGGWTVRLSGRSWRSTSLKTTGMMRPVSVMRRATSVSLMCWVCETRRILSKASGVEVAVAGGQGVGDGLLGRLGGDLEDAEAEDRHLGREDAPVRPRRHRQRTRPDGAR